MGNSSGWPDQVKDWTSEIHGIVHHSTEIDTHTRTVITRALVTISRVSSVDHETFYHYAESVSTLVESMIPDHQTLDESNENAGLILGAMEDMTFATNISNSDQDFSAFSVTIRTVTAVTHQLITIKPASENTTEIVQLSPGVFVKGKGRVLVIRYKNMHKKMSKKTKKYGKAEIGSKVVSIGIQTNSTKKAKVKMKNAVYFTVRNIYIGRGREEKRLCMFWDVEDRSWSDNGCRVVSGNHSHTRCSCDHLTSFAVLVLYFGDDKNTYNSARALFIMTAVGCSLSIAGLAMTLFSYVYLRILHREKILIHANLAASLLCAQLVFVSSSDAHQHKASVKFVAILLHFFFMASFTWMMVEGLCLYLSCTRGMYNYGDMRVKYMFIGWGVPIVIVLISFGVEFPNYGDGTGQSCWLSLKNGLIWAFMGPMLLVVMFNLIILALVIKVFLTLRANSQKTEAARLRASLRATGMLLPLLGTTWLLSILVPFSSVFHYFFVIGNSLQGMMIFFLHCLCNEEVRKYLASRRNFTSGDGTSDTDVSGFWKRRSPVRVSSPLWKELPKPDIEIYAIKGQSSDEVVIKWSKKYRGKFRFKHDCN
ncbi:adhesion G-protein coupled receptor D1-like [Gigantopelta aegis]|uniref:adhesion G-protein coupled receptor D1-like n=1 Tax=Gigantopelta aegis TaxID=1735272 RepID=UPI001B88E2E4|nr:adhesion G-protein coupled receptor D1-like [Gigantopelta aegis]